MCGGIKGLGRTWIGDQGEEVPLITLFTGDFFYNNRVGSSLRAQEFGREIKILVGKKKKKKLQQDTVHSAYGSCSLISATR